MVAPNERDAVCVLCVVAVVVMAMAMGVVMIDDVVPGRVAVLTSPSSSRIACSGGPGPWGR